MPISLTGILKGILIRNDADQTKQLSLEASSSATTGTKTSIVAAQTANRTITLPDSSATLADISSAQTISQKTLDNTNSISVKDSNLTIQDNSDTTKQVKFEASSVSTATTRTVTVPDLDLTLLGTSTAQVVTNKDIDGGTATNSRRITVPQDTKANLDALTRKAGTILFASDEQTLYIDNGTTLVGISNTSSEVSDSVFRVKDNADGTKKLAFEVSGITTGTTRTMTIPDSSFTVLGADTAQVVTNKDVDGGTASNTRRLTIPQNTIANLTALTRKAGTLVYATDETLLYIDNGTSLLPLIAVSDTSTIDLTFSLSNVLSASIISGSITNTHINASAAIDATKIANGNVSNTEFQYLDGVTSAIQTQLDAKVAKSTYSAKGSILAATAASTPADLPVGTNGYFLKADSSQSTGLVWASAAGANLSVRSVTTTDTPTTNDDILILSGASFTVNLFTAVGNSGKVLRFIFNGTAGASVYTIDGNGSEAIGPDTTFALDDSYQVLTIVSNGTNWSILDYREYPGCELILDTGNGHGSTNTAIRKFTNTRKSDGNGTYYNYNASATAGMSVTILKSGVYEIFYQDVYNSGAGAVFGISVNATALTTSIGTLTYAQGKRAAHHTGSSGYTQSITRTMRLAVGDVVRAHTDGLLNGSDHNNIFALIRVRD